jgi:predicted NBD/HSP70 family sugar kinase
MRKKGLNMENIKNRNRQLILEILERFGAMSRKDLSEKMKLTQAALTLITTDMLNEGIIFQVGEVNENRVGRKKILLDISYDTRYVVGINFEKHETLIAVSNIKGDLIKLIELEKFRDENQLEKFCNIIETTLKEVKVDMNHVCGFGIGMYGFVDPEEGIIRIKDKEIKIVDYLSNRFNKKVVIDNNVRALAISEMFFNKNLEYFFFVKYGPGIGSSIVYNKEVLYGSNHYAGEIGHVIVSDDDEACKECGKRGCLENYVDFDKVIERVKNASKNYPDSLFNKKVAKNITLTMNDVMDSIRLEEEFAMREIDNISDMLAKTFINFLTVNDFEKIILYGEMFNNPIFMEYIKTKLMNYDKSFDLRKLELSKDKFFPKDLGGVYLAIKNTFYKTGGTII